MTPRKLAEILEILNDGQWHMLNEVQKKMKLNENQSKHIIAFLKEYEFIAIDERKKQIKLEEDVRKFLTQNATS